MPNKTHGDLATHIDNAAGVLTDVSVYVQSGELDRVIAMLEDTGEGLEESTFVPGLGSTKFSLSGFWNTTTEAIFGPLISDNTSISKTFARRAYSGRFYKGETWVSNLKHSGSRDTLQTFSAELQFTGALTRTSVVGA